MSFQWSTLINMNIHLLASFCLMLFISMEAMAQDANTESVEPSIPQRIPSHVKRSNTPLDQNSAMKWLAQYLPKEAGIWLPNGNESFFALWQPDRSGEAKGAILIVHAEGEHPTWPQTTKPLHDTLPDSGWATLAISLPATDQQAKPKRVFPVKVPLKNQEQSDSEKSPKQESADNKEKTTPTTQATISSTSPETVTEQRLTSTLKFLHDHGQFNVVIMGSGVGAIRAHSFMKNITPQVTDEKLKAQLEKPIRALVIYNARNQLPAVEEEYKEWFIDPEIPVMDIFTTTDRRNIKDSRQRQILAKQKNLSFITE